MAAGVGCVVTLAVESESNRRLPSIAARKAVVDTLAPALLTLRAEQANMRQLLHGPSTRLGEVE